MQLPLGIADQHKADVHWGQPCGIPQGGTQEDPQLFALVSVPGHFHGFPGGISTLRPALQAPLTFLLQGCGPALALELGTWSVIERGIQAPAGDQHHLAFDTG
jgi:hypothetical protein